MNRYDSIVVGAGHNGLACAAYLARNGKSVLVIEAAARPGGLAANREFHPGFSAAPAHAAGHFAATVIEDLDLESHGLQTTGATAPLTGLDANGEHIRISGNDIGGADQVDTVAFGRYTELMQTCADALAPFWTRAMPRIGSRAAGDLATFAKLGLKLRGLGRDNMREFMRIASLPARDLMDEFFGNELLKAMLSWDGLIGSRMAPRSPNSAVLAMLYRRSGTPVNMTTLVPALVASAEAAGATIRCGTTVDRILINGDKDGLTATGVQLADGTRVEAGAVVSAADPQTTFLNLVGAEYFDIGFANRIGRLRCNGLVAKLHLALDGLPEFTGVEQPDGRLLIAPDMDAIEFAFDDAKYGACSAQPVMEIVAEMPETKIDPPTSCTYRAASREAGAMRHAMRFASAPSTRLLFMPHASASKSCMPNC
ncbi:MAG: NAD(P)/FAD-dependent oxidoreductase [Gammaproteobacteria bacterium]